MGNAPEQLRCRADTIIGLYLELIGRFVDGRISAENFESAFLSRFKNETGHVPDEVFGVLEGLFGDVDEYVSDPELRAESGGLNDDQLRTCARNAYNVLRSMRMML